MIFGVIGDSVAPISSKPPWVRWVLLGLMAVVLAGVAATVVIRQGSDGDDDAVISQASAELLVPNLCSLNTLVERKEFAKASRYFWDRIHLNTHVISSLLLDGHRAEAMNVTRAKAKVEADMRILSPNLATSVPSLLEITRVGVKTLGLQGAGNPCSGEPPAGYP